MVRTRRARRLLISSAVLTLGLGLLVAAASAGPGSVKDGGTLVVGSPGFDFIDPALVPDPAFAAGSLVSSLAAWSVEDASCAMLLRYPVGPPSSQDYRLVPEVATGYPAVSRDRKAYTFTIRTGFRFSTGAPVTAANYAAAIRRILNPAMNSPAARYLQEVAGVTASGNKLIVRLTKWVPDFPARMTMPYLCPVPTDLPIAPEGVGAPLPGSGPYYISEFVRGSRVVLKRNPLYRGSRPHHLEQIIFQVGDDPVTNTHKVEVGQVDVDLIVPASVLGEVGARYPVNGTRFFSVRSPSVFYVFMNTEQPLFRNNPKLRQAVNFALDRTAMLRAVTRYFGSRTDSYLPPGLPGALDVHPYPVRYPDLAKAQTLAHGHMRSRKAVMYACNNVELGCVVHAQIIQYDLKQIGIDVEIKLFPNAVWAAKIGTRGEPFDLTEDRLVVPWVDPYLYINLLLDGRTIQRTGNLDRSYFNSPYYNRLIDQAGSLSGDARYAAYGKLAVDIARSAAPMAAYMDRNTRFLVSSRVGCVRVGAHGLDLAELCIK
jgi:peptide/nickel transport system substrate-binding protein